MIFRFMTKWNFLIYFFFFLLVSLILFVIWPHRTNFHLRQNIRIFLLPPMSPKNNKIKKQQKILIFRYQKKAKEWWIYKGKQELLSLTYISFLFILTKETNKRLSFFHFRFVSLSFFRCFPLLPLPPSSYFSSIHSKHSQSFYSQSFDKIRNSFAFLSSFAVFRNH